MSTEPAPEVSLATLEELLRDHYHLEPSDPRWLEGEYDRNLRITAADGSRWVVKISASSALAAVAWQEALLTHLERHTLGFAVPRILPTITGDRHVQLAAADNAVVRVLSWVDGALLSEIPQVRPALLRSMGETSAKLTTAFSGFQPLQVPAPHHWLVSESLASFDLLRTRLAAEVHPFATRLDPIRDAFAQVKPVFELLPQGVVHQDLHDQNLLVSDDGMRVVGAIDFNDAHPTALVADLAVTAAYGMLRQADAIAALAEVIIGYTQHRRLSEPELQVILPAAAMRLAINWMTWADRGADGGAGYAQTRSQFTQPTLTQLLDEGLPAADHRLRSILSERGVTA